MHLKLNLNCHVKINLTKAGFQHACNCGYQKTASKVDDQGYSTFQLWNLIEIFGSKDQDVYNLIQPFQVLIDSADLHGVK